MNKILTDLANFNQKSNDFVAKLLADLKPEDLTNECGSYYSNLESLFSHLSGGQVFFINFIAKALPTKKIVSETTTDLKFTEASKKIEETSQILINLASTLSTEELDTTIDFHGQNITVEHLIHRAFIHSTHHRGQISTILDQLKIEHDMILLTPVK